MNTTKAVRGLLLLFIIIAFAVGRYIAIQPDSNGQTKQVTIGSYEEARQVASLLSPQVEVWLCDKYGTDSYPLDEIATGNWGTSEARGFFSGYAKGYKVNAIYDRKHNDDILYLTVDGDVLINDMDSSEAESMAELGMPWE